jgi:hypothetical protein
MTGFAAYLPRLYTKRQRLAPLRASRRYAVILLATPANYGVAVTLSKVAVHSVELV